MNRRISAIIKYVKDGDVLDVGCLQHKLERTTSENWLHGKLCEKFSNVIGIDISKDVLKLRKYGYEVYQANAEDFNINKKFDTIVAGELIEHLSNPGKFLECARKHLKKDGILILTTPNPFWIEYWIRKIFRKLKINKEHTAWFDLQVLEQLASRYGFSVQEYEFISEEYKPKTFLGFIWHMMVTPILRKILPKETTGECILVVLKVDK